MYVYTYIYIYIERERERERCCLFTFIDSMVCMFCYILCFVYIVCTLCYMLCRMLYFVLYRVICVLLYHVVLFVGCVGMCMCSSCLCFDASALPWCTETWRKNKGFTKTTLWLVSSSVKEYIPRSLSLYIYIERERYTYTYIYIYM